MGPRLVTVLVVAAAAGVLASCGGRSGTGPALASPDGTRSASAPGGVVRSTTTPLSPPPPAPAAARGSDPLPTQGVVGRVTARGRPVVGAMVQPAPGPGNPAAEREAFARSAADGSFALGLPAGAWTLTIAADGYPPRVIDVVVGSGVVTADVELEP